MTRSIHRSRFGVTSRHTGYSAHADPPELDFNLNGSTTPHDKAPRTSGSHTGSRPDHVRITPEHVRITYHTGPDHVAGSRFTPEHTGSRPDHLLDHAGTRTDHVSHRAGSHWITSLDHGSRPEHTGTHRITPGSRPDHTRITLDHGSTPDHVRMFTTGSPRIADQLWIRSGDHVRIEPFCPLLVAFPSTPLLLAQSCFQQPGWLHSPWIRL